MRRKSSKLDWLGVDAWMELTCSFQNWDGGDTDLGSKQHGYRDVDGA